MAKLQAGYPENWSTLTPQQKRRWRLDRFVKGEGIKFVNPEAEKAYHVRAQRLVDVYDVKEPDQMPFSLPVGDLPYIQYGINFHTAMYEIEKAIEACKVFNAKYSTELEHWAVPYTAPGKAFDDMDYKLYAWPGHGLAVDAPGYQVVEGEYMKADEYADLLRDPSDFWFRTYLPRVFGILEPLRDFSPLTDIIEMPLGQVNQLTDPRVRAGLRKLAQVGDELFERNMKLAPTMGQGPAHGFPNIRGGFSFAPFDILGDTLRGTTPIMKDMYRRPEEVVAAVDLLADINIHSVLSQPNAPNFFLVSFPLHKGADGWMSPKQFDKFYWPSLKKFVDALNNEGLIVNLFAEGSFNTRLESVNVFPKGFVTWLFDQTDMAKAKKVLGQNCCIHGNVPSSLIVTGNPRDVKAYCKKLIETCAPGGGYIFSAGANPENPKLENIRAMYQAAKEYGVYRK